MTSQPQRTAVPTPGARNVPARISVWAAFLGICLIVAAFATPLLWVMFGGYYTLFLFVSGVVAIPAGHLGRRRGKRLDGRDRGLALLGIVTGWLLLICGTLLVLVYAGLMAGLAYLAGSTG